MDYKKSGVDIEAGESLVSWLKSNQPARWPHQDKIVSGIGGFSALFRADFKSMEKPCLVSATDGVGTKLKLAIKYKNYKSVAQDLVAMCVNDMICCGAEPLFFLDYYATGKLEVEHAKSFLGGVQQACVDADCALMGGETAEMPGMYQHGDFDCAGFSVGVVDQVKTLGSHKVEDGDLVLGVSSNGFHSNGYSLLRKIFEDDLDDWQEELLKPTALYVKLAKALYEIEGLNAMAHITGGGMDNLLRVLPKGSQLHLSFWDLPAPVVEVKRRGKMSWRSLFQTLNCGMGLALIVSPKNRDQFLKTIENFGFKASVVSKVNIDVEKESAWTFDELFLNEKYLSGDK
ncbi:MAG: phosphoribosylformylglycinamidine cyclo-ligase [Bdellovibrionaceae bacterium]|jgi:phosphoribosylformylglycinamidine cyclo-ligase|nr:phosphoribosylformylglycinamidine cyclo-ligase [Pseudobdellovibrionaceae bacterium]